MSLRGTSSERGHLLSSNGSFSFPILTGMHSVDWSQYGLVTRPYFPLFSVFVLRLPLLFFLL